MQFGGRIRPLEYVTKHRNTQKNRRARKKEEGSHQTYIVISIPRKDEGKTLKQIWEHVKEKGRRMGWYVGETFDIKIGARGRRFWKVNGRSVSGIQEEMVQHDSRAFQVAVIITSSEDERKALEELVIRYLMQQEEINKEMKMLNKEIRFKISPELRGKAANCALDGFPLIQFEEEGEIDPTKLYDLGYICTLADFKERYLSFEV